MRSLTPDQIAALTIPRTFVRVYRLPAQRDLINGYCMNGPVPITFGNVDWFEVGIDESKDKLIAFVKSKRYYNTNVRYLVLGDHPDFVFTIDPE